MYAMTEDDVRVLEMAAAALRDAAERLKNG
jgi:hypothetical protein